MKDKNTKEAQTEADSNINYKYTKTKGYVDVSIPKGMLLSKMLNAIKEATDNLVDCSEDDRGRIILSYAKEKTDRYDDGIGVYEFSFFYDRLETKEEHERRITNEEELHESARKNIIANKRRTAENNKIMIKQVEELGYTVTKKSN
jgi:hypothetical protein